MKKGDKKDLRSRFKSHRVPRSKIMVGQVPISCQDAEFGPQKNARTISDIVGFWAYTEASNIDSDDISILTYLSAELQTLEGHYNSALSVAFSPDGRLLTSGSWDRTIKLWDPTSVMITTIDDVIA